jgi:hypothetical protein
MPRRRSVRTLPTRKVNRFVPRVVRITTQIGDIVMTVWGTITGSIASQTDLNSSLNGKAASSHSHVPTDVTGTAVVTADSRLTDARVPTTHDNTKHTSTFVTATEIATHAGLTTGVHGVGAGTVAKTSDITATAVGLGSCNNTSDLGKPVSTATQTALDLKANLASPTFTSTPAAPTAAVGTNTTQLATTAFVMQESPYTKVLTSDFTTSSLTAVSTNLTFAIGANEVWVVDFYGMYSKATSATGLKLAVGAPTGCTVAGFQKGGGATLAVAHVNSLISAINSLLTTVATGIGIKVTGELHFRVVNSSTAGSITIQMATVTGNVATMYAGSYINFYRATQV